MIEEKLDCTQGRIGDLTICSLCVSGYLEPAERGADKSIFEGFTAVVRSKNISPSWSDVKTALLDFDRTRLRAGARPLHCEQRQPGILACPFGLGHDQLRPFKASISRWISPDLMKGQPYRLSKPRRRLRNKKKPSGARLGRRCCRYFIARKHSAFWNLAVWRTKNTLPH